MCPQYVETFVLFGSSSCSIVAVVRRALLLLHFHLHSLCFLKELCARSSLKTFFIFGSSSCIIFVVVRNTLLLLHCARCHCMGLSETIVKRKLCNSRCATGIRRDGMPRISTKAMWRTLCHWYSLQTCLYSQQISQRAQCRSKISWLFGFLLDAAAPLGLSQNDVISPPVM